VVSVPDNGADADERIREGGALTDVPRAILDCSKLGVKESDEIAQAGDETDVGETEEEAEEEEEEEEEEGPLSSSRSSFIPMLVLDILSMEFLEIRGTGKCDLQGLSGAKMSRCFWRTGGCE
jgi:hypothetical protein